MHPGVDADKSFSAWVPDDPDEAPEPVLEVVTDKRNGDMVAARLLPLPPVQAPSKVPPPKAKPKAQTSARESRGRGRRAASKAASRRGPPSDDDPLPAPARSPLTRAERDFLRAEVDRLVRAGIADQRVLDKALFKARALWGEAGVLS
jgi:hypothetical protein